MARECGSLTHRSNGLLCCGGWELECIRRVMLWWSGEYEQMHRQCTHISNGRSNTFFYERFSYLICLFNGLAMCCIYEHSVFFLERFYLLDYVINDLSIIDGMQIRQVIFIVSTYSPQNFISLTFNSIQTIFRRLYRWKFKFDFQLHELWNSGAPETAKSLQQNNNLNENICIGWQSTARIFPHTYSSSTQKETPEIFYIFVANHQLCQELSVSINRSQGYYAEMDFCYISFAIYNG